LPITDDKCKVLQLLAQRSHHQQRAQERPKAEWPGTTTRPSTQSRVAEGPQNDLVQPKRALAPQEQNVADTDQACQTWHGRRQRLWRQGIVRREASTNLPNLPRGFFWSRRCRKKRMGVPCNKAGAPPGLMHCACCSFVPAASRQSTVNPDRIAEQEDGRRQRFLEARNKEEHGARGRAYRQAANTKKRHKHSWQWQRERFCEMNRRAI
jgi:hypothetical protein